MPELPEVETMVRGIRPHIAGREITAARRCRCSCKPMLIEPGVRSISRRVVGSVINKVHRIGKRVVLELSTRDSFVIEPRMTGITLLSDPPDRGHLRFEWQLAGDGEYRSLWFWDRRGLGTIRLLAQDEMVEKLGPTKLGPDALAINEAGWREQCSRTSRAIKPAMLDQKLVAGIGNLYASEILHAAKIHPECPADQLKPTQIRRLADAVRHILTEAIRAEGSTLGDGTYRNALNQDGGYQNQHRVYARDGERCPTCSKTHIVRIVQNQRSTFFCPACQRK